MNSNKLILGTVQFGLNYGINNRVGKVDDDKMAEILDFAFEAGVKILDTAEVYGDSQKRIGNYHRKSRHTFQVVTKFHSAEKVDASFDIDAHVKKDIKVLSIDKLYGYMFHSFVDYEKHFSIFREGLLSLKIQGLIEKIGVSVYTNEELEKVMACEDIDLVQLPYNLFDNEKLRGKTLENAKQKNIEIHTRSAFLQGLFFKEVESITGNLKNLKNDLSQLHSVLEREKIDMATCALNYPISKKHIDKVLIGVDTKEQLQQNIQALKSRDLSSVFETIDNIEIENKELLNPSLWKI